MKVSIIIVGLLAIPIVLLCRYISLFLPVNLFKEKLDFVPKTNLIMTWGGLRGGISIALALGLSEDMHRDMFFSNYLCCGRIFNISTRTYSWKFSRKSKKKI